MATTEDEKAPLSPSLEQQTTANTSPGAAVPTLTATNSLSRVETATNRRLLLLLNNYLLSPLRDLAIHFVVAAIAIIAIGLIAWGTTFSSTFRKYSAIGPWTFNETYKFSPKAQNLSVFDDGYTTDMILFDGHSHTTYSDGKMSVDELIQWHIQYGYNAFALTDHNKIGGKGLQEARELIKTKYNNSLILIPGVEWTTCRFHMNFLGINSTDGLPAWDNNLTDDGVRQLINEVHKRGGVVTFNHRRWSEYSGLEVWSMEQLLDFNVDFIEAANQEGLDFQAIQFARKSNNKIGIMAGSDVHSGSFVPHMWGVINATSFSEAAIMDELRNHRESFILAQVGVPQLVTREETISSSYIFCYPWVQLGWFLTDYWVYTDENACKGQPVTVTFHWDMVFSSIFWLIFVWLFIEAVLACLRFIWRVILKKTKKSKCDAPIP